MPTIREISIQYGVSKSTARRWIQNCMPDIFNGSKIDLNASQMHELARFIEANKLVSTSGDTKCTSLQTIHRTDHEAVDGSLLERIHELELENVALRATNESLERSNELLLERLEVADKALEREQMQSRGFWSRLGQKLLGNGQKKLTN